MELNKAIKEINKEFKNCENEIVNFLIIKIKEYAKLQGITNINKENIDKLLKTKADSKTININKDYIVNGLTYKECLGADISIWINQNIIKKYLEIIKFYNDTQVDIFFTFWRNLLQSAEKKYIAIASLS